MSLEKLAKLNKSPNIAKDLDEELLVKIGHTVIDEFDLDDRSRDAWTQQLEKIMKIAKQVYEVKNTPWPGASNVKFPLIANASIQFAARNYPEIIRGDKVVRFSILGDDKTGYYQKIANAIEQHMSYQLLSESNEWERTMDKLLHMIAVVGLLYTKVYYDPITRKKCIDVCSPDDIIVHDDIKSLESARRISHRIYLHKNDIISGINKGIYSDIIDKIGDPERPHDSMVGGNDPDALYEFIEQHRYWDLDDDGYQEPYIITVHRQTGHVLRVYNRWDMDKIILDGDRLIKIEPVQYFTAWPFIPSPDGKWHALGFGSLLYPINHAINTLINQLIDSGTLSNNQSGIVGRGVRIKGGTLKAKMGEFIVAEATDGTALRDNIFPFPTKDPSPTLYQLLGLMIDTGNKLAAVTDIMTGQQEAQNAPASSVLALEEQGLKVFTGIQKRLYSSLKADMEKLFRLNRLYFDDDYPEITIDSIPLNKNDYVLADRFDLCPVFDPDISTDIKRLVRAQALLQLVGQGLIQGSGAMETVRLYLKELRIPEYELDKLLVPPPPPPPDPGVIKAQLEAQRDHVKANLDAAHLNLEHEKFKIDALLREAEAKEKTAKAQLELEKARHENLNKRIQIAIDALGKVDPEKGITTSTIQPVIDHLLGAMKDKE